MLGAAVAMMWRQLASRVEGWKPQKVGKILYSNIHSSHLERDQRSIHKQRHIRIYYSTDMFIAFMMFLLTLHNHNKFLYSHLFHISHSLDIKVGRKIVFIKDDAKCVFAFFSWKNKKTINWCIFMVCCLMCVYGRVQNIYFFLLRLPFREQPAAAETSEIYVLVIRCILYFVENHCEAGSGGELRARRQESPRKNAINSLPRKQPRLKKQSSSVRAAWNENDINMR